jgi:hypothetical protein
MLRKKAGKQRALRIYFATDVHGSEVCFRKFLAAAKVYEADVIILGGDFAGKAIVPVLTQDGTLRSPCPNRSGISWPAGSARRGCIRSGWTPRSWIG